MAVGESRTIAVEAERPRNRRGAQRRARRRGITAFQAVILLLVLAGSAAAGYQG